MEVVIDFAGVNGERSATRWSHAVTFQVARGKSVVIRTSSALSAPLFRLCLGFSTPGAGTVTVQGQAPSQLNRGAVHALRRGLGCALDPDGLVANLSLRVNLIVPLVFATGLGLDEASARADNMLDVMHLALWSDMRPAALPAEVRQTAALARALCPRSSLLLLENPLASVDDKETRRLLSLCRVQAETLLIATHRHDTVLHEFADTVWEWDDDGFRMAA